MMKAKFRVDLVENSSEEAVVVKLSAVTDGSIENSDFNKYTPSGQLEMYIDNPVAKDFFKKDKEYYLDFTECMEA